MQLLRLCAASAAIATVSIAVLITPVQPLHAQSTATIEIIQEAPIPNALGSWTLVRPDNSRVILEKREKYKNTVPPGRYTLIIKRAQGATTVTEVTRNEAVESSKQTAQVSITIEEGDNVVIRAVHTFTIIGNVAISSEPKGVRFTLRGPNEYTYEGRTPDSMEDAPVGQYSVQYHPPTSCPQPKAQSSSLEEGNRISFFIELSCEALEEAKQEEYEKQLQFVTVQNGNETITLEDVPMEQWYAPFVFTVAKLKIMSGYKDAQGNHLGKFGPERTVSLAQLVKVAHEVSGIDEQKARMDLRNQRAKGTWFEQYYRSAEQLNWQVFANARLDPGRPATRSEVITTLLQALDVYRVWPKGTVFRDVGAAMPYAASIETAVADGIIATDSLTFRPDDPINRAELAKIIVQVINVYIEDSPEITGESY